MGGIGKDCGISGVKPEYARGLYGVVVYGYGGNGSGPGKRPSDSAKVIVTLRFKTQS
ncbi:MAG: hypothetical protein LBO04_03320 [Spirochaetaceae bacterium]|jgi:hypothetical protein|nr:hypothetical protein [Spirochaetaceae bacterium]